MTDIGEYLLRNMSQTGDIYDSASLVCPSES